MNLHGVGDARRQPAFDIVRYQRHGSWQVTQYFDSGQHCAGSLSALGLRVFHQNSHIFVVPGPCVTGQLTADVAEH